MINEAKMRKGFNLTAFLVKHRAEGALFTTKYAKLESFL